MNKNFPPQKSHGLVRKRHCAAQQLTTYLRHDSLYHGSEFSERFSYHGLSFPNDSHLYESMKVVFYLDIFRKRAIQVKFV